MNKSKLFAILSAVMLQNGICIAESNLSRLSEQNLLVSLQSIGIDTQSTEFQQYIESLDNVEMQHYIQNIQQNEDFKLNAAWALQN